MEFNVGEFVVGAIAGVLGAVVVQRLRHSWEREAAYNDKLRQAYADWCAAAETLCAETEQSMTWRLEGLESEESLDEFKVGLLKMCDTKTKLEASTYGLLLLEKDESRRHKIRELRNDVLYLELLCDDRDKIGPSIRGARAKIEDFANNLASSGHLN